MITKAVVYLEGNDSDDVIAIVEAIKKAGKGLEVTHLKDVLDANLEGAKSMHRVIVSVGPGLGE